MMRDMRNPEQIGQALSQLKQLHPEKTAAERANMLDEAHKVSAYASLTANGKNGASAS